jgi:hypothetical protein
MTRIYIDTDELAWLRRELERDASELTLETFQLAVEAVAAIDDAGPFAPLKTAGLQLRAVEVEAAAARRSVELLVEAERLGLFALAVGMADAGEDLLSGLVSFSGDAWRVLGIGADRLADAAVAAGRSAVAAGVEVLQADQQRRARVLEALGIEELRIGWAENAITIKKNGAVWLKSDLLDTHLGYDATSGEFAAVISDNGLQYVDGIFEATVEVGKIAFIGGKLQYDTRADTLAVTGSAGVKLEGGGDVTVSATDTIDLETGRVVERRVGVEADIISRLTTIKAGVSVDGQGTVSFDSRATMPFLDVQTEVGAGPGEVFARADIAADYQLVHTEPGSWLEWHPETSIRR